MGDPLLSLATTLQYYKRREVQEAMLRHCANREVSPRYGEGFGKRPDVITYPADILEFAKRKTTSFHVSEERWDNPLSLKTGANRKDVNDLRIGWDLVLDIDAKDWDVSRLAAWLCISVLQDHGVGSISAKFSGSKGWHIGVPFESFPQTFFDDLSGTDLATKDFFPELPRAIAGYLMDQLSDTKNGYVRQEGSDVIFGRTRPESHVPLRMPIIAFAEKFHKAPDELFETYCPGCKRAIKEKETYQLVCMNADCQFHAPQRFTKEQSLDIDDSQRICSKCRMIMEFSLVKAACPHNNKQYVRRFNMTDIIQVDTILLAGRHLYRMPYSLHEKSGLASVVIDPRRVLTFEKREADPKTISFERTFLDISAVTPGEAEELMRKAWDWQQQKEEIKNSSRMQLTEFETPEEAIPEEHFPPCMRAILAGMADGKKRAMFALTNFFTVCGWSTEMIEKRLHEWNEKNPEPLREVIIKGHMHSVRLKKDKILPPNCKGFYQELGVCKPDEFCSRSKNPAQYGIKHAKLGAARKKAKKAIKGESRNTPEEGVDGNGAKQAEE